MCISLAALGGKDVSTEKERGVQKLASLFKSYNGKIVS